MNHNQKKTLARKLQSKEEAKTKGDGIFESKGWENRKSIIAAHVNRHKENAMKMAAERRARKEINL